MEFDLNKEINEWRELLIKGEIDEDRYNIEVERLIQKDKNIKRYGENNIRKFVITRNFYKLIIFLIIIIIVAFLYNRGKINKNIEIAENLNDIKPPIQKDTTGKVIKEIDNVNVEITYVSEYTICGRIVDVQSYYGNKIENKLSPKDVGITWGFLANQENHEKLKWSSPGNRFLTWTCSDIEWVDKVGGKAGIGEYFSNNHLIPRNKEIEKLMNKIKKDDYIKIEGYLVNVYFKTDKGYGRWDTSTSRIDRGDGACEIIYVTNITWLK